MSSSGARFVRGEPLGITCRLGGRSTQLRFETAHNALLLRLQSFTLGLDCMSALDEMKRR